MLPLRLPRRNTRRSKRNSRPLPTPSCKRLTPLPEELPVEEECPELVDSLEEPLPVLDLVEMMDLPSRKSIKSSS